MSVELRKITPYYLNHLENNAKMLAKGGWLRPKVFTNPEDEVNTVRTKVGLIDAHSMGKFNVVGKDAFEFMQILMSNDLSRVEKGKGAIYTCLCNEEGGIVDDVVVYYLDDREFYLITNTLSGPRVKHWLNHQRKNLKLSVEILDTTSTTAYLAVQGPLSEDLLKEVTEDDFSDLSYFAFKFINIGNVEVLLARTGYTGEKGYELNYPAAYGYEMWNLLLERGEKYGIKPIGGVAIQVLRSEKAYRSHGTDMFVHNNPYEMGLGWTIRLNKGEFIGSSALSEINKSGPDNMFIGFQYEGDLLEIVPADLYLADTKVGRITTTYRSPTLNTNIALGLVETAAQESDEYFVDGQSNKTFLKKVAIPFYDPESQRIK